MSSWIEASLQDAIAALARNGEGDLAADLSRLIDEPEIKSLQIYKSRKLAELADELHDCPSLETLYSILKDVAAELQVSHCTIHCIRERSTAFYGTKVLTTFPRKWVTEYVDRRYSSIDPILSCCRRGPGTFFWDMEKAGADPFTRHFINAAILNGIGPSGITRVEQTPLGSTIALSLASTCEQRAFKKRFQSQLSDFNDIAGLLIDVFSDLACERNEAEFNATDDQLKVLRALAAGRSLAEIEAFPFAFGSFKTIEKSILKSFGAKTLTQAAALAVNQGILEDLPYFPEDVFTDGEDTETACVAAE